jgi:hypothetical protein
MPLHYLDPQDEPRPCPNKCDNGKLADLPRIAPFDCGICHGAGHLGNPNGPRVKLIQAPDGWIAMHAETPGVWAMRGDPRPTEAAALEAARTRG